MDDAKHPGPSCLSQHSSALGTSYPQSRLTLTAAPPTSYAHRRAHAQGRSYRIFRHNVFHHIGHISTLAQPTNRYNPGCYALMYDWLLPAEVFNEKDCPDDDLWPCKEAKDHAPAFFPTPRLQFSAAAMKPLALVPEKARVLQPLSSLPQLPTAPARRRLAAADDAGASAGAGVGAGVGAGGAAADGRSADPGGSAPIAVVAKRAESCDSACARWRTGGRCTVEGLQQMNTCEAMVEHLGCADVSPSCETSIGGDQPARVAAEAPPDSKPGKCLINGGELDCAGSHSLTTRLCACHL